MSELKPCPFCGSAEVHKTGGNIICGKCAYIFCGYELWQSRPIESALRATIAERDAEIERLKQEVQRFVEDEAGESL